MKEIRAVIFDMDGVLINSEPLWQAAERKIFTSLGVNVTAEHTTVTQYMTTTAVTAYWYTVSPWQGVTLPMAEQMVIDQVIEMLAIEDCLIAGVKEFIESLKSSKLKIGLATNSPYKLIPFVLERAGIGDLFDGVVSAESEHKGKPDPAVYLAAAQKLDIEPSYCLAIEDSKTGMLAAKRAGMQVAAFVNGRSDLNFNNADYIIKDYRGSAASLLQRISFS